MKIILALIERTRKHHNSAFAAQIAFYFFLSIFPFIIVFITTLGNTLDVSDILTSLQASNALPIQVKELLQDYIDVANKQPLSILSLSFLAILWATSGVYYALSHAFGMAYGREHAPNRIIERLKGLLYTAGLSIALALAIILPSLSQRMIERIVNYTQLPDSWLTIIFVIKIVLYVCALGGILSASYYMIPKKKFSYRSVWAGTLFTSVVWWLESYIFNVIVLRFSKFSLIYGTLSTVAIMMVWLFTLSSTLIIGAELNAYLLEEKQKIQDVSVT